MKKYIWVGIALVVFLLISVVVFLIGPSESTVTEQSSSYNGVQILPDIPKDTIVPLDKPDYESPLTDLNWLQDDDLVIGVEINGDFRAFPVKIMNWHEIVNDRIGGEDVVVTYCPLCGSAAVYSRNLDDQVLDFGNTGALYESGVVMYDRQTNSYWHQMTGQSIRGEYIDRSLGKLPSSVMTWKEWNAKNQNFIVLSINTGYSRDYLSDPFADYTELDSSPGYPVSRFDDRLANKEPVLGVEINGKHKAYVMKDFKGKTIEDEFEGAKLTIIGNEDGTSAEILQNDKLATYTTSYWFAWYASYPETEIYRTN